MGSLTPHGTITPDDNHKRQKAYRIERLEATMEEAVDALKTLNDCYDEHPEYIMQCSEPLRASLQEQIRRATHDDTDMSKRRWPYGD